MRASRLIDWDQDRAAVAAIVAAVCTTMVAWWNLGLPRLMFSPDLSPIRRPIEALEQFNRNTRLLVLDQDLVEHQSAHALTGHGCCVRDVGGGNGRPPTTAQRQMILVAAR